MLSSIHPLGERARHNRWWLTVGAFTLGSVISGGVVGTVLGSLGVLVIPFTSQALTALTAIAALTAGGLDLIGVGPPGPERQVNETWIGAYRGWVYGGAFGLELGLGVATYVVTWGVYAMFVSATLTSSPLAGAVVGATFGLGRSATLFAAGYVDRPTRLTIFNRRLARVGPMVRLGAGGTLVLAGIVVLGGSLL